MRLAISLALLLTLYPVVGLTYQPRLTADHRCLPGSINNLSPDRDTLRKWFVESARRWNVSPSFLMAVAYIESRQLGKGGVVIQDFRLGEIGRGTYYGPMGIHKGFKKKWDIWDPKINIEVGAAALAGVGSCPDAQKRRLRRYNTEFNDRYFKAIKAFQAGFAVELKEAGF